MEDFVEFIHAAICKPRDFRNGRRAYMGFLTETSNKLFGTSLDPAALCLKMGVIGRIEDYAHPIPSQAGGNSNLSTAPSQEVEMAENQQFDNSGGRVPRQT